ncbi:Ankyrin repeat domain-containing protein 50, partial [Symbiodinium microadriaticum]
MQRGTILVARACALGSLLVACAYTLCTLWLTYACALGNFLVTYACALGTLLIAYAYALGTLLIAYACALGTLLTAYACALGTLLVAYACALGTLLIAYACALGTLLIAYACALGTLLIAYACALGEWLCGSIFAEAARVGTRLYEATVEEDSSAERRHLLQDTTEVILLEVPTPNEAAETFRPDGGITSCWPPAPSLGARAAAPEVRCHAVRLQLGDRLSRLHGPSQLWFFDSLGASLESPIRGTFCNCCASAMIAMWAYGRARESLRLWARILYGLTFAIYGGGLVQYAVAAAKLQDLPPNNEAVTMGTNVMLGAGNCLLSGIPLCVCCIGRTREEALNEHLSFRHHEQREEKRIAAFQEAHAAYAGYGAASYTTAGGTFDQPASFDQSWQQSYSQEGWPSGEIDAVNSKRVFPRPQPGSAPKVSRRLTAPSLRLFFIMFGGGMPFTQGGGSPEKPQNQKRADDRTNFLPVTIRMLDTASEAAKTGDGEVRFHGSEASPGMLTVLVQIETVHANSGSMAERFGLHCDLWRYGYVETARHLLQAGVDKDHYRHYSGTECHEGGRTALARATTRGRIELVRLLIDAGASKDTRDEYRRTALTCAASKSHTGIFRLLLEAGADKHVRDVDGKSALVHAASRGNAEIARLLVEAGAAKNVRDVDGKSALVHAASRGNAEIARLLVEAGAAKNVRDVDGKSALVHAASRGNAEIARLLVEAGAAKNVRDVDGKSALVHAASRGNAEIARLLVEAGAAKNVRDVDGKSALVHAASKGYTEIARLLVEARADIDLAL